MAVAEFIVDTSAFGRIPHVPAIEERLVNLMERALVATSAMLDLEALWSARDPDDYEQIRSFRGAILEYVETIDAHWQRALEVQRELAARSKHRSVKLPDLLIAAVAELDGLTLLHYDSDFEYVAEITGQSVEWVVPRGSE
ncbi:PIN domain nuclease [Mumia sp. DW29H23]|uniref:PIN domain nuclease n=1 Tax=Mumia sp. DW29H23 TaxID=3421241 RepID=UPI003D69DC5F